MKNLSHLVSPTTMVCVNVSLILQIALIFRPSLSESASLFAIDFLMLIVAMKTDAFIFGYFFPESKDFYPSLDESKIAAANDTKKRDIYLNMTKYPAQRSLYMIPANIIKITPAALWGVLVWQHGFSTGIAFVYAFTIVLFNVCYMSAMAYLENHAFLSNRIGEIHQKYNWSSIFLTVELPTPTKTKFSRLESLSIIPIWIFVATLQAAIIWDNVQSVEMRIFESALIALFASFFTMRIVFVSRAQLLDGLRDVFDFFHSEVNIKLQFLPLNTSTIIAYQQKTLNNLLMQTNSQEKEISSWLIERIEKKRYTELGEIAALVVHDVLTPMHTVRYCVQALNEKNIPACSSYVTQMKVGVDHSIDLLENLKSNVRNSRLKPHSSCIFQADKTVRDLLAYHFKPETMARIAFNIEKPAESVKVAIPQPELNQVMMNLYMNSVNNLISNNIEQPSIKLCLIKEENGYCYFCIQDNGTGMTVDDFAFITDENRERPITSGIGLRLTRRLVEHHAGSLKVTVPEGKGSGTAFYLGLKKCQEEDALESRQSALAVQAACSDEIQYAPMLR